MTPKKKPKHPLSAAFKQWQENHTAYPEYAAICTLHGLYAKIQALDIDGSKAERWRLFQLAAYQSHELFTKLQEHGVQVILNKRLLKNRIESSRCGPQELPFFQDLHVIKDLLKFILIGAPQ